MLQAEDRNSRNRTTLKGSCDLNFLCAAIPLPTCENKRKTFSENQRLSLNFINISKNLHLSKLLEELPITTFSDEEEASINNESINIKVQIIAVNVTCNLERMDS